jgi:ActR/RegA family two-component response regulator
MIYFVDEDLSYARQFTVPLVLRGYEAKILLNADRALDVLSEAKDIELAIVDVMLATADARHSRFRADDTDSFLETGLALMRELNKTRPDVFPRKFAVLTAASEASLVGDIETACRKMQVPHLKKGDFKQPKALADRLVEIMQQR